MNIDNDNQGQTPERIIPTGDYDDQILAHTLSNMDQDERAEMAATGFDLPESVEDQGDEPGIHEETVGETPAEQAAEQKAEEHPVDDVKEERRGQAETPMIPKARLDEVLRKADDTARYAAFLEGKIEALTGGGAKDGGQQHMTDEPKQDRVAELTVAADNLDKAYEDGEITTGEYMKQSRALTVQIAEAQAQAILDKAPTRNVDDMRLDELTVDLERNHPYLYELSDKDIDFLAGKAREQAAAAGRPIDTSTSKGVYELRKSVAELSDRFGPVMTGKALAIPGQQAQPQPPAGARKAATPPEGRTTGAQARAEKLDLQTRMPPDISQIGRAGTPQGLTDEGFLSMAKYNPADLENISAAELDRLLRS